MATVLAGKTLYDTSSPVDSQQVTLDRAVDRGMLLIAINIPGGDSGMTFSATDTQGNTYTTVFVNEEDPLNNRVAVLVSDASVPLSIGDVITVSITSGASKAVWHVQVWNVEEALGLSQFTSDSQVNKFPDTGGVAADQAIETALCVVGWSSGADQTQEPAPGWELGDFTRSLTYKRTLQVGWQNYITTGTRQYTSQLTAATSWTAGIVTFHALAAPDLTITGNQDVEGNSTVAVDASASDEDGTISSYAWEFDYPLTGAPALTGANSQHATFTCGTAGSFYVLRCTATDNDGNTTSKTTEVRVPFSGTLVCLLDTGVEVAGDWTPVGAATIEEALADASTATYVSSEDVGAIPQTYRVRMMPSAPRDTGAAITFQARKRTADAITVTVSLYQGKTKLIQTWDVSSEITTGFTSIQKTIDDPNLAQIADWGDLWLEFTVEAAA